MSVNGVNGRGFGAGNQPQGSGASSDGAGKEFALEKQKTGSQLVKADGVKSHDVSKIRKTTIADKKRRNYKGAPRTVLVDGQIYEIYLLAIA